MPFLRCCGIVQADHYDEFVETVALFASTPPDAPSGRDIVLVSGSGGGAALAADHLDAAGLKLAQLSAETGQRIRAVLPEIGEVTNPIDATGADGHIMHQTYRGRAANTNWMNGSSEMQNVINNAFSDSLNKMAPDLQALCAPAA